jgi:hypothetical protein
VRAALEESARNHGRTLSQEINHRVMLSFSFEPVDGGELSLQALLAGFGFGVPADFTEPAAGATPPRDPAEVTAAPEGLSPRPGFGAAAGAIGALKPDELLKGVNPQLFERMSEVVTAVFRGDAIAAAACETVEVAFRKVCAEFVAAARDADRSAGSNKNPPGGMGSIP